MKTVKAVLPPFLIAFLTVQKNVGNNDMRHALIEVPAKHPSVAPRPRRQCHRLPKTHHFELKKNLILIYYYQIIE